MDAHVEKAYELGFSQAVYLSGLSLECKPEIRAYCNPQDCPNHGQNWVCPPGCGPLEACAEKAREFSEGILLQSVSLLDPPVELEHYKALNEEHNLCFKEFIESVKPGFAKVLPLTSGGCVFCEECCYPDPCIKPEVKMESLSAFGIDVGNLCELAGLDFSFRADKVFFVALLLVKP
ncbi:MAG: DUF2284 domain-containing protein [Eggerthellaceae bacterium]|nr:DUF2284 domain-containing protein [Eggerthellaceae bacterium]